MSRLLLPGLVGSSPLGFLASVGLLRLLTKGGASRVRLGFVEDGTFTAYLDGAPDALPERVAADAADAATRRDWWLTYDKMEKRGVRRVADLKAPPEVFASYLAGAVAQWVRGEPEAAEYAAAFGTDVAKDGNENTKPTALHFTAAQQTFLGNLEEIRASVTAEWASRSLFVGGEQRAGKNLRWDPAAERSWALMAANPNDDGTRVDAPAEWLAFRALPVLPTFPVGGRIVTTGVHGRGEEMTFTWPLWSPPASLATVRSMLRLSGGGVVPRSRGRGVIAVCQSSIRRTSQGFGNFGPAHVTV